LIFLDPFSTLYLISGYFRLCVRFSVATSHFYFAKTGHYYIAFTSRFRMILVMLN
jgi:hypothetical protein